MTHRKILQITSYPPPRAGWGVRVEFLKKQLEANGHSCVVLNIGRSRTIPSSEYETVQNGRDYLGKVWRFSRRGYIAHVHVNGDSPKGFVLTLIAEFVNVLWGNRCFLTFHAGVDQLYFPRRKFPSLLPMYWVMFAIPRLIICNSDVVKAKICEYGVPARRVVPIPAFSKQYLEHRIVSLSEPVERFYERYPAVLLAYIKIRPGFYQDVLLDGFARVAAARSDVGMVVCGLSGDIDPVLMQDFNDRIACHALRERVYTIDDFEHDAFLTALLRSSIYVRTPTTDGVASSVLESLSLGIPVVASENGTRPHGTITYEATSPEDFARVVLDTLANRASIAASLPRPEVRDTLSEEMRLLTETA